MAKKINLEELKMENLKKAIIDIDSVTDTYQRTHLRLLLVQTINGMSTVSASLPEGRDALDNSKTKTDNKSTASAEALNAVNKAKEALAEVMEQPEVTVEDPEIAPVEAMGIDADEIANQEDMTAEANLERDEEEIQSEMSEGIGAQVESLEFDPGDGNLVEIAPQYNALINVPDDDNKQILAYYLAVYDEESVMAITSAFSSEIESDPYALLNENNYLAYLEYFNECLQ